MQAIPTAIEDVIVATRRLAFSKTETNFFSSGTQSCLLHCQRFADLFYEYSDTLLYRLTPDLHRSVPAANSPIFTSDALTVSAVTGCRGCQILDKLLEFMLISYSELQSKKLSFKWLDTRFTLEVQNNGNQIRRIQFFYPKG